MKPILSLVMLSFLGPSAWACERHAGSELAAADESHARVKCKATCRLNKGGGFPVEAEAATKSEALASLASECFDGKIVGVECDSDDSVSRER